MSEQKIYDFSDPTDYQFDSDLIDFTALQKPRLKLQDNPGQDFTEDFSDDTDFTYDSDLAEFVGGKVQQKDTRPPDATFYAPFTSDVNGAWGNGTLTGTAYNGAAVSGGKLDLSGSLNKYIDYDANLNADFQQIGCLRFKWTPKYTGAGTSQNIIEITESVGNANNRIRIYHQSTLLFLNINDQTGATIVSSAETFSPTADTEYEFELDFDITSGATRLFIDGVQLGTTNTNTGTRSSSIGLVRIGKDLNGNGNANFLVDDLIFFSIVQHTANYTPDWSDIYEYKYLSSNVICPEMESTGPGTLITFDTFTTVEGDSPRYTLQIGRSGDYLYWDGAAWSVSDGTYAQSNSASTFNANLGSLDIEGEIYGQFKIHFPDSNTQSYVDTLTASLTAQIYSIANPSIVFNDLLSMEKLDNFIESATKTGSDEIKYVLSKNSVQYYWNGSAWVVGDGTYSQSNTAAEILTNKTSFTTEGITFAIKMFLHSADGTTTPTATSVTITYDFYGGDDILIIKCNVWGYCVDENDDPVSGVSITIELERDIVIHNPQKVIFQNAITTTTDLNGYWDVELIPTADLDNIDYRFTFSHEGNTITYRRKVPAETSKNFSELTL